MTATTDQPLDPPVADAPPYPADGIDDPDDDLQLPAHRRRVGLLTMALILVLVGGLGAYSGIWYQKNHGHSSSGSTASVVAALASRFGAGRGTGAGTGAAAGGRATGAAGGFGGFGGGAGGATTGTVKLVDGNTIYLSQTDGSIVKVTTTPTGTTVTKTVSSSVSAIQPGETLVVQGSTGSDGTVTATRVTDAGTVAAAASGTGTGTGTGG
jgi:hypothetical protein